MSQELSSQSFQQMFSMTSKSLKVGGNGGNDFRDPENIISAGSIRSISVRCGARIDAISVTYGNATGAWYGGNGGEEQTWVIPKDYEITSIEISSGREIDSIKFIATNPKNPNANIEASPRWGGSGGSRQTLRANGLPLREIRGRVGARIDQLEFCFGYRVVIKDVKIDSVKLFAELEKAKLVDVAPLKFENNTPTAQTMKQTYTVRETQTESFTFSVGTNFTYGQKTSISVGLEGIGSVGSEYGWSITSSLNFEQRSEKTTEKNLSHEVIVDAEPNSTYLATMSFYEGNVNVPFNYRVCLVDESDNEIGWKPATGIYDAILIGKADTSIDKVV